MPYTTPTLAELDARIAADVEARLPGTDPLLRRTVLGAVVRALAGAHHELYGYVGWIARQVFPDTAESAELDRWAAIWGVARHPARAATGTLTVTGTAGTAVPAGTLWQRGDGVQYASGAEATLTGGTAAIAVTAVEAGTAGNADAGVRASLVSPIAGVVAAATAATALAGGAAIESDEGLRERLLARLRTPPRGGTVSDYVQWARAGHTDVTRAWARANTPALGQVTVYLMTDEATDNGIPAAAVVSAVQTYIDARRPVTAGVTVAAPTAVELDFTFTAVSPTSAAVRTAIAAELADLITRASEPGGTILLSHIREAISTAAGEHDFTLTAPAADVEHTAAQIAVMGDITWP